MCVNLYDALSWLIPAFQLHLEVFRSILALSLAWLHLLFCLLAFYLLN